jgi:hypothetical protein
MKTRWLMTACATALLVFTSMAAVAQDQGEHGKGEGRGHDKNHGEHEKRYRRFNEKQQRAARDYYDRDRDHEVFRRDERWNDDYERRLRPGYVFDDDMRRMCRPAPYEMTRGLGRPPRGYRYVLIGPHVVLIDSGYRVHDAIHLEINIGH